MSTPISLRAEEWEQSSPYYEDDGWLDVTEWLDGNDYNPTDEAWWRWDDETYSAADDTSGDRNSDVDRSYGYRDSTRDAGDRWFYDYYDPYGYYYSSSATPGVGRTGTVGGTSSHDNNTGDKNPEDANKGSGKNGGVKVYSWGTRYYDYDRDGSYDASLSYRDSNGDGAYDRYNYVSFSKVDGKQQQSAKNGVPQQSQAQAVSGTIDKVKMVQVRTARIKQSGKDAGTNSDAAKANGGAANAANKSAAGGSGMRHVVVSLKSQDGKETLIDLGKEQNLSSFNLKQGQSITARGPMTKVGDKTVLLADSVEVQGQTQQIDRNPRTFNGTVQSTHTAKMKGRNTLFAIVQTQQFGKLAVDFGPSEKVQDQVKKDQSVSFSGVPVKVNGKRALIAQRVKSGNTEWMEINRPSGGQAVREENDQAKKSKPNQNRNGSQNPS